MCYWLATKDYVCPVLHGGLIQKTWGSLTFIEAGDATLQLVRLHSPKHLYSDFAIEYHVKTNYLKQLLNILKFFSSLQIVYMLSKLVH